MRIIFHQTHLTNKLNQIYNPYYNIYIYYHDYNLDPIIIEIQKHMISINDIHH